MNLPLLGTAFLLLAGCVSAGAQANGMQHLVVNGRERSYLVDLPPDYDGVRERPLVLVFHGGGGSPSYSRRQSQWSELGASEGAIVVYPAGSSRFGDRLLTWNAGTCCGFARKLGVNDVSFVRALLDTLQGLYHVDRHRVFATGMSNGGMLAHLVACRLADRFAAVAVVSGELTVEDCAPSRPVSVLMIHGTADQNPPFNGGVGRNALDPHNVHPVSFATDRWRTVDNCIGPVIEQSAGGRVTRRIFSHCAPGVSVELRVINGGGHAWPPDAAHVAWSFFQAHPRP